LLIGEVIAGDGGRRDIQLKGSGRTPFSRGGDGRAALGPVLREYLISDAMHALGIPTTRALAAVSTGDAVRRETMLPGAVLTRVAASHVRIGTFQFFASRGETGKVRQLADHVIARHYPELTGAAEPYLSLFEAVMERQASLVARWMHVGFIHGVMNTDNVAVSGETIDYGPCAFMNAYNPATVFSSIDQHGRYAYGNQPRIAQWNLARFAETLLPLIDTDADRAVSRVTALLEEFPERYARHWLSGMRRKLGLMSSEDNDDTLAGAAVDHGDRRRRFHQHVPRARPGGGRRRGSGTVAIRRSDGLRRLGGPLARPSRSRASRGRRAERANECGEPGLHPAQPSGRGGSRSRS
jgi:uncharacterized protein YdiU (UPF0061 family)